MVRVSSSLHVLTALQTGARGWQREADKYSLYEIMAYLDISCTLTAVKEGGAV